MISWSDNDQFKRAMFGTPQKLYEHNGDTITDITPVSTSVTLLNAFTIALSATTVTVSATAHGRSTGDLVFFTSVSGPSGGVTIGGNIILGSNIFAVSVVTDNVFAFDVDTTASVAQNSASQATIHYVLFRGVSGAANASNTSSLIVSPSASCCSSACSGTLSGGSPLPAAGAGWA